MIRPLLLGLLLAAAAGAQGVGDAAPEFEARTLDGDTLRLADLRGRHVLLEFWGTWCAPCVAYAPRLAALRDRYPEAELALVGVALDDADSVRQFTEAHGQNWPQIVEPNVDGRPVTRAYGVRGYPTTFVVDPDGVIVYRNDGYDEAVEALLAEALDG